MLHSQNKNINITYDYVYILRVRILNQAQYSVLITRYLPSTVAGFYAAYILVKLLRSRAALLLGAVHGAAADVGELCRCDAVPVGWDNSAARSRFCSTCSA